LFAVLEQPDMLCLLLGNWQGQKSVGRSVSADVTAARCARNTLYHVLLDSVGQRARKQAAGRRCFGVGLGEGGRAGLERGPSVSWQLCVTRMEVHQFASRPLQCCRTLPIRRYLWLV